MAKDFATTVEDFKGINLKGSKLTGDLTEANSLLNLEFSESESLRGRCGSQPIGQVGSFKSLHSYGYSDVTTAATAESLLAANDTLWILKSADLTVTGGANVNWQLTMNPGSLTYRFVIQNGTTPYVLNGNNYYDLGHGLEREYTNSLITVEDLRAAIDANATLACALPAGIKFARVNGNQTGVNVITVDAGHNYVVGDWMAFYDYGGLGKLCARKVSAVGATTITFSTLQFSTVTVRDNEVIGPMAAPAAGIGVRSSTAASTTITFQYWDTVPYTTDFYQAKDLVPWPGSIFNNISTHPIPHYFLEDNNVSYIYDSSENGSNDPYYLGAPFKFDGQTLYREGLPRHTQWSGAAGGAAGNIGAGTYRYKVAYVQYDAKGNYIQGRTTEAGSAITVGAAATIDLTLSNAIIEYNLTTKGIAGQVNGNQVGVTTITVFSHKLQPEDWVYILDRATGAYVIKAVSTINSTTSITVASPTLNVNNGDTFYFAKNIGFNYNYAQADETVAGACDNVTTIPVYDTVAKPNTLRGGDKAYFYDRRSAAYIARTITAVTSTSITIAGDAVSLNDNDAISNNLRVRIWRTKAGGNIFYEVADVPHNALCFQFTYTDSKADSDLGAQLFEPISGKEQDLPPKATIACIHQGTRCSSGDPANPNTVYIYSTLDREAVPIASNSFDVSSSIKGPITGIFSDSDDRLAIFKPKAYYQATGALDDNAFTVQAQSEGDRGVSSQHSLARVNNKVVGVGPLGPITVQQGQILGGFSEGIYPAFTDNFNVNYKAAISVNDSNVRHWTLFVPSTNMTDVSGLANALFYSMDYGREDVWFDRSFPGSADPAWGMTVYDDTLYFLSSSYGFGITSTGSSLDAGHAFRRIKNTSTLAATNLYWDVNQAIPQVFEPSWFTPYKQISVDKEFHWFKLFCAPGDFETDRFTSFTPTLVTYKNYNDTSAVETLTLTTLTTTVFEAKKKLLATKMRSILFRVTLNTGGVAMFITGFEPVLDSSYMQEQPR